MFEGRLLAINISPDKKQPMESVQQVEAIAGQGLRGDRYSEMKGAFQRGTIEPSQEVTLIEREAIEAASRDYELKLNHSDTRRNLLTDGVPLNHLVGKTFQVGEVTLRGVKLCEPCSYLESLTFEGIEQSLLHRGGLRTQVVTGGTIRVNDVIRPIDGESS